LSEKRKIRCVVTGSTGFIGSNLIQLLVSRHFEVICPVREPNKVKHLLSSNTKIITFEALERDSTVSDRFEYFFHLAGATRALNYEGYYEANVKLAKRMLDFVIKRSDPRFFKKFVLVSSQAVSGPADSSEKAVTENDVPNPISLYARSKLEAEKMALTFADLIPLTIVRPSTVFGPRDIDVLGVFKSCKYGVAPCLSGKDRRVSVVFVDDLIEGIVRSAFSENSFGETYFLTNPDPVIWRDFIKDIARVMGSRVLIAPLPKFILRTFGRFSDVIGALSRKPQMFRTDKIREMDQMYWICSSEKARRDLDWVPQYSVVEALTKTFRWYKDNGWL
jgi:dihydroflavonol-4-reductase